MASPALVFGSAWHNAVESLITGKTQDPVSAWNEAFGAQIKREDIAWGAETPEDYREQGARLIVDPKVQEAIKGIAPYADEQGLYVERFVKLQVPGVDIPIIGYIDVMTADMVPCDIKTSARAWTPDKLTSETQPLFYLAALNQAGFRLDGTFRHFVFTKTKTPQVQVLEEKHKVEEVFWLFDLIQHVWAGISGGVFPCNPTGWKCSPSYCDHWALCRGKYL